MTPENLSTIALLILKLCVIGGFILYSVFAGIFVRQEQLMAHVLEEGFEPVLRLLVILHFAFSVGLILLAVMIL